MFRVLMTRAMACRAGADPGGFLRVVRFDNSYRTYSSYSDRQTLANSIDPDQTPQNAASDQGLHCLPVIQQFYKHSQAVNWTF